MILRAASVAALLASPALGGDAALELRAETGTLALAPGAVEAAAEFDMNGRPAIGFQMAAEPARAFAKMTAANIGRVIEVVVCGEVLSAPRVLSEISGGKGQITGDFAQAEVEDLARRINEADCAGFTASVG